MLSELEIDLAKQTMARMVASGRVKVSQPLTESQVKTVLNGHAHERQRGPARRRVMRSRAAVQSRREKARVRMRKLRAKNSSIGKIRARAAAGGTFTWKDFPQMSRGLAGRLIRRLGTLGELVLVKAGRPGRSSGEASRWRKATTQKSATAPGTVLARKMDSQITTTVGADSGGAVRCTDLLARFRVVALFVQSDGCYSKLEWVDAWPQERDARKYDGNLPVVAHPPCQLWGNLAAVNFARYGGEHNRPGNDGGCFAAAVAAVRRCGGVLEHPRSSKAFSANGITPPKGMGWQRVMCGGWVCEVWQSAYGHRANKATWLYYYGDNQPAELRWNRIVGTHQVAYPPKNGSNSRNSKKPALNSREANATPEQFRDALLSLALRAND